MDYICVVKKIIITFFILITFFLACKLSVFYIPFLIAYILSLFMEPIIKWVKLKTNFTRKVSSILVIITIFSILFFLLTYGVVSLISESTNLLNGINTYLDKSISFIKNISDKLNFENFKFSKEVRKIGENAISDFLKTITNIIKDLLNVFLDYLSMIPNLIIYIVITILATYFITSDKFYILDRMEHHLSKKMVGKISKHTKEITSTIGNYLKANIILISISFFIILIGLNILKFIGMDIKYPILMSILIGFVDALPILRNRSYNGSLDYIFIFK